MPAATEQVEAPVQAVPEQEPPCSVPGTAAPTTEETEKIQFVSTADLAALVSEGVKKALEEREAASKDPGAQVGLR